MDLIGAWGQAPRELGGYRDHNPFRLFVREQFRAVLRRYPGAKLLIVVDLGAGHWMAEVAREEGRRYNALARTGAGARWSAAQLEHQRELLRGAEGLYGETEHSDPCAVAAEYLADRREYDGVDAGAFVAMVRDSLTGPVAEAVRTLGARHVHLAVVSPDALPPAYRAMAAVEDFRGAVPDGLLRKAEEAADHLGRLIDSGKLRPRTAERASRRYQELRLLATTLRALLHRGDGEEGIG